MTHAVTVSRRVMVTWVTALSCVVWAAYVDAGLVQVTTSLDRQAVWEGFEPGFQPDWEGETTVAKVQLSPETEYNRSTGSWGIHGTMNFRQGFVTIDPPSRKFRSTVRRVSSSASVRTSADATYAFGGEEFAATKGDSDSGTTYNRAKLAHFAEVVTENGTVLSNASALAYQTALFLGWSGQDQSSPPGDASFSADGRVSAGVVLASGADVAFGEASGWSGFDATYELEKETPFSLTLDLAWIGDAELLFTAADALTDELLFSFSPTQAGARRQIELSGVLEAGRYAFSLEGLADTWIDATGQQDPGGLAMYDVSLDFEAESYQVPVGSILNLTGDAATRRPESEIHLPLAPSRLADRYSTNS